MKTRKWGGASYFAQLIGTRRRDLQHSVAYTAAAVGISPSTLYAWERGELGRLPRPRDFNRLCRVLKLDPVEVVESLGHETGVAGVVPVVKLRKVS